MVLGGPTTRYEKAERLEYPAWQPRGVIEVALSLAPTSPAYEYATCSLLRRLERLGHQVTFATPPGHHLIGWVFS